MQHLVENNTFRLSRIGDARGQVSAKFALNIRSLVLDWQGYEMTDKLDLSRLCPRLRSLELSCDFRLLRTMLFHLPVVPTSDELRKSSVVTALSNVRGLSHFKVRKIPEYHGQDFVSRLEHWDQRVALVGIVEEVDLIEDVLRSIVTAKKIESTPRIPRAAKKIRQY
jgi:hypothetical protein